MEFQERFATDEACLEYLAASRWPEGFVCPGCGSRQAWVLERRHRTRTPLRLWFWAAYLVATHHPGISAKQLSRQLGLRYETAWLILQKLRRAMIAPERELLRGEVEIDECWIGGVEPEKQGRGPGAKTLVGVAVEVRGQGSGRLRLAPLADAASPTLDAFVKATTAPGSIVHTDGWKGYNGLSKAGFDHRPRSQRAGIGEEPFLPRAHRAISNLKAWMLGTHRGVSKEHLPVYLDEYVFRHNRRRTPMAAFQTLLGLGAAHEPATYEEISQRDQAAA
jgi:transposase-like protein